jgi:methylated-DNA-[protein]-cysteine S-methyltransferase
MRTSTRRDKRPAPSDERRQELYETEFGVGRLVLAGDLPLELELPDPARPLPATVAPQSRWAALLGRYFAGERVVFDLDVRAYAEAHGLTSFETAVYTALATVPYGSVVSYRDLAAAAGRPNAYRAVGSTMARNELPVILACHRVVKNDGRLGFYGDDPAWKGRLLELEGVPLRRDRLDPARGVVVGRA